MSKQSKHIALFKIYWYYYKSGEALNKVFNALERNNIEDAERYEKLYELYLNKVNSCE